MSNLTKAQQAFIDRLGPLATADMQRTKVLASLTMAQAILESGWGTSGLTVKANNLFGIKTGSAWTGRVYSAQTQECYDGVNMTTVTAPFRAYDRLEESITDHSALLTGAARYKAVVGETDYKAACKAIKAAGYATDPGYAVKLINLIDRYGLTRFDVVGETIVVVMGSEVVEVLAVNTDGNWYMTLCDGSRVKIRNMLAALGYMHIAWEPVSKTITAGK